MLLSRPQALNSVGRIAPEGTIRPIATSSRQLARSLLYSVSAQNPRGIPALSRGDVAESYHTVADGLLLGNSRKLLLAGLPALGREANSKLLEVPIGNGRQDASKGLGRTLTVARLIGHGQTEPRQIEPLRPVIDGDPCLQQQTLQVKLGKVTLLRCVAHGCYLKSGKLTDTRHIESLPWGVKKTRNPRHIFARFPEGRLGGNGDTVYRDITTLRPVSGWNLPDSPTKASTIRGERTTREGNRANALNRAEETAMKWNSRFNFARFPGGRRNAEPAHRQVKMRSWPTMRGRRATRQGLASPGAEKLSLHVGQIAMLATGGRSWTRGRQASRDHASRPASRLPASSRQPRESEHPLTKAVTAARLQRYGQRNGRRPKQRQE